MATVREWMERQRQALRAGKSLPPGPPVLLEAARNAEVLLPKPAAPRKKQVWSTQPFTLDAADADQHKQERIDRMIALQPLVDEQAEVIEIVHQGQHPSSSICLGRAKRNDVVIEDETISSLHAAFEDTGAVLLLIDRGSSNGTFLNQQRLEVGTPEPLASGDCLRFGRRAFYFLSGERLLLFLELRLVKPAE